MECHLEGVFRINAYFSVRRDSKNNINSFLLLTFGIRLRRAPFLMTQKGFGLVQARIWNCRLHKRCPNSDCIVPFCIGSLLTFIIASSSGLFQVNANFQKKVQNVHSDKKKLYILIWISVYIFYIKNKIYVKYIILN